MKTINANYFSMDRCTLRFGEIFRTVVAVKTLWMVRLKIKQVILASVFKQN